MAIFTIITYMYLHVTYNLIIKIINYFKRLKCHKFNLKIILVNV